MKKEYTQIIERDEEIILTHLLEKCEEQNRRGACIVDLIIMSREINELFLDSDDLRGRLYDLMNRGLIEFIQNRDGGNSAVFLKEETIELFETPSKINSAEQNNHKEEIARLRSHLNNISLRQEDSIMIDRRELDHITIKFKE